MSAELATERLRVVVTRKMPLEVEKYIAHHYDATFNPSDRALGEDELRTALSAADVVVTTVTDAWRAELFEGDGIRTRLLANVGVGVNHIALDAARRAGVMVSNTPDVVTDDTADVAIALMLMAMRRLSEGERHIRTRTWTGLRPTFMLGRTVRGKTLGIVGYGRIGRSTARAAASAFGMKIVYYSPREPRIDDPATAGPSEAERVTTLDELLECADVVSLHCPSTSETRHLIDARALSKMQRHAVLVNTARGDVVDEAALVEALKNGTIAAAGLDVFEFEPKVSPELMALDNVAMLPHLGSATIETRSAMGMRAMRNVDAMAAGTELPDRVI